MRLPLVRKELRELRPYLVLGLVFTLIEVLGAALEQPDLRPLGYTFHSLTDETNGLILILACAVGMGIATREREQGTLAFLDGLPISRSRLFLAKLGCAVPVLMVFPMGRVACAAVTHLLSRGSLDGEMHPSILATLLGLQVLMVLAGLLFGAAVGLLRSLAWLVGALAATGLEMLGRSMPRARVLNPVHLLLEPHLQGAHWQVDREGVGVQLALAILFGLIAWVGFTGVGAAGIESVKRRPLASALVSGLTIVALIAALALSTPSTRAADEEVRFPASAPAEEHTDHYLFSYRSTDAAQAHALAKDADAIFTEVHTLLRAPLGEPITVDLTGSMRNTAGTAFLGRIRMELGAHPEVVLAHETSHVVAGRLAGADRANLWNRATVLDEGLATWVERHREANPEDDALVLGTLQARHEVSFDELVDFERFARVRDEELKYPLGNALVEAMVDAYGEDAPGRLASAFANPTLPASLKGMRLWQATFQLAGMDLGRVGDELFAALDHDAEDLASEIAKLPRPRATLVADSSGLLGVQVAADWPPPRGWRLVVRFRPNPSSTTETYDNEWVPANGDPVWRASSQVESQSVCLQPGIRRWPGAALYEPWSCLSAADAAPWSSPAAGAPIVDGGIDSTRRDSSSR